MKFSPNSLTGVHEHCLGLIISSDQVLAVVFNEAAATTEVLLKPDATIVSVWSYEGSVLHHHDESSAVETRGEERFVRVKEPVDVVHAKLSL